MVVKSCLLRNLFLRKPIIFITDLSSELTDFVDDYNNFSSESEPDLVSV